MADPVAMRFHRSLYSRAAIDAAAERFARLGLFRIEENGSDVLVTVEDVPERLRDRMADEFGNHALQATIAAERG